MPEIEPSLLEHIKTILRRDLKLGAEIPIADDMAFFGSDIDLDSLDMLLLVTSIEKEFGIKVPSEAVGKEVFANVATLARYVQENKPAGEPVDYLSRLPHRAPFLFITKTTAMKEGESGEGIWSLSGDEPFFAGHFPGRPIVPGVLIVEALAQLSGVATTAAGASGKLVQIDVRFDQPVVPPADITLATKLTRSIGALQVFDVKALVGGTVVARGSITLHRGS